MTFNDVKKDIVKLIGLDLESVKPGSGIRILSVDEEQGNLQLRTVSGHLRSRPLFELERIWNELQISPAVHVDRVLNGSGTSRNQPETILANLPYIEWAKIHNKKHLIYVKESTHPYGTLRQMDKASSAKILAKIDDERSSDDISLVIVTTEIKSSIDYFINICGGVVTAREMGVYLLKTNTIVIAFVTPSQVGLDIGTYPVIETSYAQSRDVCVSILGDDYCPIDTAEVKVLLHKK